MTQHRSRFVPAAAIGGQTRSPLTVVILTRNEEVHLRRALDSVAGIAERCVVVDSGSTDRTVEIARKAGAEVLAHPWVNHATQFNWALDQLPRDTGWVLRLDADEIVTPPLAAEIRLGLGRLGPDIAGVYVSRRIAFLGRPIRWGGVFPIRVLRLFRHGAGRCEERWMDEHIIAEGRTATFEGEILDDNRNSLTWWTEKHNAYASREVVDLLTLGRPEPQGTPCRHAPGRQPSLRRWLKDRVYARLPAGARALAYFLYRYVLRLGILDGREGMAFHVLQGFWYRYLVDAKLYEVRRFMTTHDADLVEAIDAVLGIDLERRRTGIAERSGVRRGTPASPAPAIVAGSD